VEHIRLLDQLQNCGLTIGDIKEILFLRDPDTPVASKRDLARPVVAPPWPFRFGRRGKEL